MSIQHLLKQTVAIKNPSGTKDKHGKDALGSSVTYLARFQKTTKIIMTADKERQPIDGIVFVDKTAVITKGAQVTYGGVLYRVMTIEDVVGRNGDTNHFELMVQLWSYAS